MKKKDKILILIILALGLIYEATSDKNFWQNINKSFGISKKILDKKYPNEFKREDMIFEDISSIFLDNKTDSAGGVVIVNGEEEEKIIVQSSIFVYHKDKNKAAQISSNINYNFKKNNNGELKISLNNKEDFNYKRTRIYYKLILPKNKTLLTIKNAYGDISVNGRHKKISIENKHGLITVSNSSTDLNLNKINHCRLNIDNFDGNLMMKAKHSFIRLLNCNFTNSLYIKSAHSDIICKDNSTPNIQINSSHDKVTLKKNLFKEITCKLSHASFNLYLNGEEKNIILDMKHSKISLRERKNNNTSYNVNLYHGTFKENGKILGNALKTKTIYNREGQGSNFIINGRYSDIKLKTD